MKFIKILHYVEKSFENKPSSIILMDDGKEYINNGCVWIENTESNISDLIKEYDCKEYIDELLLADSIEICELTDDNYTFRNSPLTSFSGNVSKVTNASKMFENSQLTNFDEDVSNVTGASDMFSGSQLDSFPSNTFDLSQLTSFSSDMSKVNGARYMFYHSQLTSFSSDIDNVTKDK